VVTVLKRGVESSTDLQQAALLRRQHEA